MKYRKLPGGYSTLLGGGRLRLADDHILAVQSFPMKEYYRRFYLRDIQAITITRGPRFVLTNRSLVAGLVLSIFVAVPQTRSYAGVLLGGLILCWFVLCLSAGCVCRLYTAVSDETLPVRRVWLANKLLDEMGPLIQAAQSDVVPAEAVLVAAPIGPIGDDTSQRPPEQTPQQPVAQVQPTRGIPVSNPGIRPTRTVAAMAFVLALASAAGLQAGRHYLPGFNATWPLYGLLLIQLGLAVWMILEQHRRRLADGPQRLGIVHLAFLGIGGYTQLFASSFTAARGGSISGGSISYLNIYRAPEPLFWDVYGVGCLVLALAGVIVLLLAPNEEPS